MLRGCCRLQYYDPKTRRVGLTHRMAQIEVDVNLVGWERLDYKLDQLYQFIGELAMEQHTVSQAVLTSPTIFPGARSLGRRDSHPCET